ncbi:MAG: hypothetical protein ACT4PT_10770 [Methanobacteriota archaeon]
MQPNVEGNRVVRFEPFTIHETAFSTPGALEAGPQILRNVPWDSFEFRVSERAPVLVRVAKLESLAETLRDVDVAAVEQAVHTGRLERWVGDTLSDRALAREVAGLRSLGKMGEALRMLLYSVVRGRLQELGASPR